MDTPDAEDRMKPGQPPARETGIAPQRSEGLIEENGPRYSPASAAEPPPIARHAPGPGTQQQGVPTDVEHDTDASPAGQGYEALRGHFAADFAARQARATDPWQQERTFTHAEPNYRAGYDAGIDLRHDGSAFEAIEPELRHEYATRAREALPGLPEGPDDEATWLRFREEIRVGFERAREAQ